MQLIKSAEFCLLAPFKFKLFNQQNFCLSDVSTGANARMSSGTFPAKCAFPEIFSVPHVDLLLPAPCAFPTGSLKIAS